MKKLLLLFTAAVITTACCKGDQFQGNYQTPLPEATQTGKGTFSCYVDGKAYIAKKNEINAYYQYTEGYYAFSVSGAKKEKPLFSIIIGLSSSGLIEGNTYNLSERTQGNPWGGLVLCMSRKFLIRVTIPTEQPIKVK